jgi:gluconolactonase
VFGPDKHGALIDGIAFDSYGNLWGTHVFNDQIFAITPDGELRIILDDDQGSAAGEAFLEAFWSDAVRPEHMLACGGTIAPWMASVTFGGPDLRTVYVGSLRGTPRSPPSRARWRAFPWFIGDIGDERLPAPGSATRPSALVGILEHLLERHAEDSCRLECDLE